MANKAPADDGTSAIMHGVKLAKTSPAFLHANSTSHTWVFSAVAELIDNAYDPDVKATQLTIDVQTINDKTCLIFEDNGAGMDPNKLHKMLSFGYCEKVTVDGHKPVGHYGNGFKSGSMRLGQDAIVFTKQRDRMSVGLLSQTYLYNINAETVLTPIVTFNTATGLVITSVDTEGSLKAILEHSLFNTKQDLIGQFNKLSHTYTGTRIIIYNLKTASDGTSELDFQSDTNDIINSERMELDFATDDNTRPSIIGERIPEYRKSLREYCSILYLKPRMKILLRGNKVKTKLVARSLAKTEIDYYKPIFLKKPVKIIFGFGPSTEDYGMMLYHKNRLIKAYEKVGIQKQANEIGIGVVGVVEVDFLEPIHNKQDFNKTDRFNTTMHNLGQKLKDYWNEKREIPTIEKNKDGEETIILEADDETLQKPDWNWAQCDQCLKWRRLPHEVNKDELPDKWFCRMNPDPTHNRCDIDEEPEDEDESRAATYKKTYKKQEKAKKQRVLTKQKEDLDKREKQLVQVQTHLIEEAKKLHKLQKDAKKDDQKPILADLERARKELEEAKRKEEEKDQEIQKLKEQRAQVEAQLRALQGSAGSGEENGTADFQLASAIDDDDLMIVPDGSSNRKRGNQEEGPSESGKKVCLRMDDMLVLKNESDDDSSDDEKRELEKRKPVKRIGKQNDLASMSVAASAKNAKNLKAKVTETSKPGPASSKATGAKPGPASSKAETTSRPTRKSSADTSKAEANKTSTAAESEDDKVATEESLQNGIEPNETQADDTSQATQATESRGRRTQNLQVKMPFGKAPSSKNPSPPKGTRSSSRQVPPTPSFVTSTPLPNIRDPHKKCKEQLANVQSTLQSLRENIAELLRMIAPEFNAASVDNIDQVVLAMVQSNAGAPPPDIPSASGSAPPSEQQEVQQESQAPPPQPSPSRQSFVKNEPSGSQ